MAEKNDIEKLDKIQVISQIKRMNKKYGKVATLDTKQRDPFIPKSVEEKIRKDVKHSAAITANDLADKHDVRVSSIKKLLKTLEEEGLITINSSSSRIKIYRPV
jgi:ribosomal protein S25